MEKVPKAAVFVINCMETAENVVKAAEPVSVYYH